MKRTLHRFCYGSRAMKRPVSPVNNRYLDIGLRLAVGIVFLIAGIAKLLPMHTELAQVAMAYRMLPESLVGPYVLALPWIEVVLGFCLILGLFTRFFSVVGVIITASFIGGNALSLSYLVSEACACFGDLVVLSHKGALAIDGLLIAGTVLIFFQRKRFMALDSQLTRLFKRSNSD